MQGWRHQLAVFSKTVAEEQHAHVSEKSGRLPPRLGRPGRKGPPHASRVLRRAGVVFRDAFSATEGLDEMLINLEAVQVFMPGMTLARAGDVRQSHGTAIADWTASAADGSPRGNGTNVYDLSPDGRIRRVVGFWQ